MANPTMYVVNQPIIVTAGQAAPWFVQYGRGTQYILPQTIQELILVFYRDFKGVNKNEL